MEPSDALHAFRCSLYECLHRRGDALFELTDAILNAGSVPSPPHLSLAAVHPRLVDLLAALATGAVGSVALVRRDISDTLPGVAIAISLVPPLSVVGFTFEAGKLGQSLGASLLFLTNVAAILGSGTVVMALYGFHRLIPSTASPERRTVNRRNVVIIITAMVVAVSVPLTAASLSVARDTSREARTLAAARSFGDEVGWTVGNASTRNDVVFVHMEGPPPLPKTDRLRTELEERGVDPSDVHIELVPARLVTFDEPVSKCRPTVLTCPSGTRSPGQKLRLVEPTFDQIAVG